MEWVAVFSLIGVIIGASITGIFAYRIHESDKKVHEADRKDNFNLMMFEKRFPIHQQAYYWWQKLNEALNVSDPPGIHEIAKEAREWWNSNCLLLDVTSRDEIVKLINLAHFYANGHQSGEYVWDSLMTAKKAIVAGIGVEYLPNTSEKPEEFQEKM
ncbi:hypothetical protein ACFLV2_03030 [Chloroflexota bacterium]